MLKFVFGVFCGSIMLYGVMTQQANQPSNVENGAEKIGETIIDARDGLLKGLQNK